MESDRVTNSPLIGDRVVSVKQLALLGECWHRPSAGSESHLLLFESTRLSVVLCNPLG